MLRNGTKITSEVSQELRNQMTAQTTTLSQILSRLESLDQDNHRQTRNTILECIKEGIQLSIEKSGRKKGGKSVEAGEETDTTQCTCAQLRMGHRTAERLYSSETTETHEITAGIEMLDVSNGSEVKLRKAVYDEVRQSLQYLSMTHRYEDVLEAYPRTFEWAFHSAAEEQRSWSNLGDWLGHGDGIYWVNGKAGSGKSTFMKHIYHDVRTQNLLMKWAGNTQLCVATFFFWNSGSRDQKSHTGLLRALLFQVFSQYPDLIPLLLPDLWAKTYSRAVNYTRLGEDFTQFWSLRQLMTTFKALLHRKTLPLKFFFMIDGLDEFDGDHEELANLFKEITECPNVKVCLSSRPWVVFEDMFGQCPNLRLQNLTYKDIEEYVAGKLRSNNAFQRLSSREPEAAPALIQEIVEKADGVFLWVKLVIQSLLSGIRNRDELSDLWERLRLMPRELEPLYNRLLDLIEPQYLLWVSKALQILRNNHNLGSDPFGQSSSTRRGVVRLTIKDFLFAIRDDLDLTSIQNCTETWLDRKCEDVIVHLTARCAGLLEVTGISSQSIGGPTSLVQYFHRTARDFLEKDTHWRKILLQTVNTDFNPNVSMMKSCIFSLRFDFGNHLAHNPDLARDVLIYAHHADSHSISHGTQVILLEKMNDTMTIGNSWWTVEFLPMAKGFPDFLKVATLYGLQGYITAKVTSCQDQSKAKELATALLRSLLPNDDCLARGGLPFPTVDIVTLLLDLGADPNDGYARSAWENTLEFFTRGLRFSNSTSHCEGSFDYDRFALERSYLLIMKELALRGANPQALVRDQKNVKMTAVNVIRTILVPKYSLEAISVLHAVEKAENPSIREAHRKRGRDEFEAYMNRAVILFGF